MTKSIYHSLGQPEKTFSLTYSFYCSGVQQLQVKESWLDQNVNPAQYLPWVSDNGSRICPPSCRTCLGLLAKGVKGRHGVWTLHFWSSPSERILRSSCQMCGVVITVFVCTWWNVLSIHSSHVSWFSTGRQVLHYVLTRSHEWNIIVQSHLYLSDAYTYIVKIF